MVSPRVSWTVVVGLVVVGRGQNNWQAPAVWDPSVRLPSKALWNFSGAMAESPQQPPPLMVGSGGVSTQAGLLAKPTRPTQCALCLCVCASVCWGGGWGWIRCGWSAKRGCGRGVAAKWEWPRVRSVQMGGGVACWADVLGVYVILSGVKGSQRTMKRTCVVQAALVLRLLIEKCEKWGRRFDNCIFVYDLCLNVYVSKVIRWLTPAGLWDALNRYNHQLVLACLCLCCSLVHRDKKNRWEFSLRMRSCQISDSIWSGHMLWCSGSRTKPRESTDNLYHSYSIVLLPSTFIWPEKRSSLVFACSCFPYLVYFLGL